MVELQLDVKPRALKSGNAAEHVSINIRMLLSERGSFIRSTGPHSLQQNSVTELMNRTLWVLFRRRQQNRKLPDTFWAEALNVTVHVIKRVTSRRISVAEKLYEILIWKNPNFSHLRVFELPCRDTTRDYLRNLNPLAAEAAIICYFSDSRCFELWHPATKRVFVFRNLQFPYHCLGGKCLILSAVWTGLDMTSCSMVVVMSNSYLSGRTM